MFQLINEDVDINELACKILWILMQLFGSECKDLLNQENLTILQWDTFDEFISFVNDFDFNEIVNLRSAISNSNSKKQKILLRIAKRLVSADKQNLELFKSIGANFIDNLKTLKNAAK